MSEILEKFKIPIISVCACAMVFSLLIFVMSQGGTSISPNPNLNGTPIIQTTQPFLLHFNNGEGFNVQDVQEGVNVTFVVASGSLTGQGNLNVTTEGGLFFITPASTGSLNITSSTPVFYPYINATTFTNPYSFSSGVSFLIYWIYTPPAT